MTDFVVFLLVCGVVYLWLHRRQSQDLLEQLKLRVKTLEERSDELTARLARLGSASGPARAAAPAAAPPSVVTSPAPSAAPLPEPPRPPTPAIDLPAATPVAAAASLPRVASVPPASAAPSAASPSSRADVPVSTPVVSEPAFASAPAVPDDSLESRIGGRWALYFGVAFIVIAASVFVKYAVEHDWVTPAMRVGVGGLAGIVLIAAGAWFVRAGYGFYGQILTGGGVAVLYVCTYAAFNFYHLIGQPGAFALMAAITGSASVLADRQQSQGLALMAVGGGFATPFLVSSGAGSETALFGYDAILVAGTMYLAHRRHWPALNLVSCLLTTITFAAWAATSWTPGSRWTTQFFLSLFGVMFLYILRESRGGPSRALGLLVKVALGGAVLLAHLGSLANLWALPSAVIVYLLALSIAGLVALAAETAVRQAPRTLFTDLPRLLLWLAVILPFIGTADGAVTSVGTFVLAGSLAAIYGLHLAVQLRAILSARGGPDDDQSAPSAAQEPYSPTGAEIALIHSGGLLSLAAAYAFVADVSLDMVPLATMALALVAGGAAALLWTPRLDAALHFCALAATLVAIAVAQHFDGAFVVAAWTTDGAALLWLGLRTQRMWVRVAGSAMFMLGLVQLLGLLGLPAPLGQRALLNVRAAAALYVSALLVGLAWLHQRLDRTIYRENLASFFLLAANLVVLTGAMSEINAWFDARGEGLEAAISLQLARTMTTIVAWMSVGTSVIWTGLRRHATWLRAAGAFIVGGACVLLVAMLLRATPPLAIGAEGYTVIANARVVATLFVIAMLWHLLRLHRKAAGDAPGAVAFETDAITIMGHAAAVLATVSEIQMYWGVVLHGSLAAQNSAAMQTAAIALGAGSLVYTGLRRSRDVLLGMGALLVVISLAATSAVLLEAAPDGYRPLLNFRTLSALLHIALLYGIAALRPSHERRITPHVFGALVIAASILTWLWLTSEIGAFWQLRDAGRSGYLGRQMTLSIVWAAYALVLIAVGMWREYAPIRYFAIGLLGVTVVKVFFVDLAELDQIYKILTAVGLGILLIVTSFLYQKRRRSPAV